MKTRVLISTAAAALLVAVAAVAAPPPGKGKTGTTTTTAATAPCKPNVAVVVTGKLAADGAVAPSTLSVTVSGGNAAGKRYKGATPVSVAVTTTTKVIRGGASAKPEALKSGDRVNILAKVCKSDLAHSGKPDLTATRVTAHAAKS